MFTSALEQSEQFLQAASNAGYATRPVQLFYALSQAGRAICAVQCSSAWQISGHGASPGNVEPIARTTVEVHASGALPLVAQATQSATWQGKVTLGELWASLPELRYFVLDPSATPVLELGLDHSWRGNEYLPGQLHTYGRARAGLRLPIGCENADAVREAVADILAPYPQPGACVLQASTPVTASSCEAWIAWTTDAEAGSRALLPLESVAEWHDDKPFLRPGLGSDRSVPSALVTWWGILLALSSLARYEPVIWRSALDIDSSPIAHMLESALDRVEERLPELILQAILF